MSRPLILRCLPSMLPLVAELERACFPDPWPAEELVPYVAAPAVVLGRGLFSPSDCGPEQVPLSLMLLLPADNDGGHRPAAYVLLVAKGSDCLIERVGVQPEQRGKGYAAALLAAAGLQGNRVGIRRWGVELPEQDLASQLFFQHLGFAALPASDESRRWFGERDAIVMTRTF